MTHIQSWYMILNFTWDHKWDRWFSITATDCQYDIFMANTLFHNKTNNVFKILKKNESLVVITKKQNSSSLKYKKKTKHDRDSNSRQHGDSQEC